MFINQGKVVLNASMEQLVETYVELQVSDNYKDHALVHNPIHVRRLLGGFSMVFEMAEQQRELLAPLGQLAVPSLSELFVAKIKPQVTV